jgi:hypothetical protein
MPPRPRLLQLGPGGDALREGGATSEYWGYSIGVEEQAAPMRRRRRVVLVPLRIPYLK